MMPVPPQTAQGHFPVPAHFLHSLAKNPSQIFFLSPRIYCNTRDNLFSAAAGAFIHWNSPILPSFSARFTFPVQLRSALLCPQQLRHHLPAV
jgi:hypothetical protein